jgi:hypothetical protein
MGSYRDDVRKGVAETPFLAGQVFRIFLVLMVLAVGMSVIGYGLGWFGEAAEVVREEFGPRAALEKYEWFKDAAAQLDKKKADIKVYESRFTNMKESYGETPRKDWDRTDKEQFNVWNGEMVGVIASYNSLAAEYNAQMAKFNWQFANVGELPAGADTPLPREFKPYETE